MDNNIINMISSLNDNMARIANSLEKIERYEQKIMPLADCYMELFEASGLNDKETMDKLGRVCKFGIDEMLEDAEAHMRAKAEEKEAEDAYDRYFQSKIEESDDEEE